MAYIVTPGYGMQLADPATVQQFETSVVNADFLALENGILAEKSRIDTANTNITNLQSGAQKTVANIAALTAIATAVVGERRVLLDAGTVGVDPFEVELWSTPSSPNSKWRPCEPITVDTIAHLTTFIAAWVADTDLTFKVGQLIIVTATQVVYRITTTAGAYKALGGLVPIVPTVAGTGVAVAANGEVTFTAVTTGSINNIFTTEGEQVLCTGRLLMSAVGALQLRYRAAGVDIVDASYDNATFQQLGSTATSAGSVSQTSATLVQAQSNPTEIQVASLMLSGGPTVVAPQARRFSKGEYATSQPAAGGASIVSTGTNYRGATTAADGISLLASAGNLTGKLRFFYINNN